MISQFRKQCIHNLIQAFKFSKSQISINHKIDVINLLKKDKKQAHEFRKSPSDYLTTLQNVLYQQLKQHVNKSQLSQKQATRRLINTHIHFIHIPYTKSLYHKFSQINSDHIGKWVVIVGTVIQATPRKTLDKSKSFKCETCNSIYSSQTTYENSYQFEMPSICTNMIHKDKPDNMFVQLFQNMQKRKNKPVKNQDADSKLYKCGSKRFSPLDEGKVCIDYQQLRLQQQFQFINEGKIPQTLTVIVEGNITDSHIFRPGDDLTITGLLSYRYKKLIKDIKLQPQLVLKANTIATQKTNIKNSNTEKGSDDDTESQLSRIYASFPMNYYSEYNLTSKERIIIKQLQFRKQIVDNFAPSIFGRNIVKLGLILALVGGVPLDDQNSKIRGHSHVLLVGQPGTGKSVLLKQVTKLADRSFFTNGIGTTSAGLSVSYYKDGADWMIQAGALVLADNGICCIDQLTLLTKKDEKSLLQCMEQQTISSAKASVIGKLNARTTVICACNPIRPGQRYDPQVDLEVNTGLSIPLLTRFDMIFIIQDERDLSQDSEKCNHILGKFCNQNLNSDHRRTSQIDNRQRLNLKLLIRKCKTFTPVLSNHEIFSKYYTEERKRQDKVKTARAFQSLCRIAEAHAKLMFRDRTILLDCITAIALTENRYFSTIQEYYVFLDEFNQKYSTNFS